MSKQLCGMVLLLTAVLLGLCGNITQPDPLLSVHVGDTAVLSCFIKTKQISVSLWYKQVIGEEPRLIISSLFHSSDIQFHNGFDNSHFNVLRSTDSFNLTIVNTTQSDSATYYCATSFSNIISFGNGTRLVIKGAESNKRSNLQLPEFKLVESKVIVPLQCSIQNELVRGGGEHRLYWFKNGSEESPSGTIYIHGNTSDACVRSSETDCPSPTCVFNLPKKNFSPSDAGLHHCALATCGEALFGNISNLNPDCDLKNMSTHLLIVIGLVVLLTINVTLNILLCCMRRSESINAIESKYHPIQATDDDVSIIQYKEVNQTLDE